MPKKNSFGRIAGLLLLLSLLWGAFFLTRSLLESGTDENQWYVPSNATMVMKIDGRGLLSKGFTEVVLDQKDNELITLLAEIIDGEDGEGFGIDYRSTTFLFSIPGEDDRPLFGFLMNLNDEAFFIKNVPTSLSNRQGSAANNDVGIILSDLHKSPLTREELNSIAAECLEKKSTFDLTKIQADSEHTEAIQLWAKEFRLEQHDITLEDITVSMDIHEDSVTIHGKAFHPFEKVNFWRWVTEDSDFHIQTAYCPEEGNIMIEEFVNSMGMKTPPVSHISLNHHYTEPAESGNVMVVPNFDATISFTDTVALEETLLSAEENGGIESLTAHNFQFGGKDFYYKQLTPTQIYIGRNELSKPIAEYGTLLRVSGSMRPFSTVKGSGFMTKMLQLSSLYTSTDKLFTRIEDVHLHVKLNDLRECKISGHICFTEGNTPIDAFLNFIVRSGMLDKNSDE